MDPHIIPEKQLQPVVKLVEEKKPRLGQGRAGIRRKVKLALPSKNQKTKEDSTGPDLPRPKPIISSGETAQATVTPIVLLPIPEIPRSDGLPSYILPRSRPSPKNPD